MVKPDLHISTLSYLEDGLSHFIKLLDNNSKENRYMIELNIAIIILDNNLQLNLLDLNNLKAKQIRKKEEKAQRRQ